MSTWVLFALGLLASTVLSLGQAPGAPPPLSVAAAAKIPAKKPEAKKPDPVPTIEGITLERGSRFLGIAVVDGNFRLSFYDEKKNPVAPDVSHAALRWPVKYQPMEERTVLNPAADGLSLTSPKIVRPPLIFKLYIALANPAGSEIQGETFVVDFRG